MHDDNLVIFLFICGLLAWVLIDIVVPDSAHVKPTEVHYALNKCDKNDGAELIKFTSENEGYAICNDGAKFEWGKSDLNGK